MDEQAGRTFLITGANTGIGRATTEALAAGGATVYMACRSEAKARPVRDEIAAATGNDNLHLLSLDLADLASVRACADAFLLTGAPLHGATNYHGYALVDQHTNGNLRVTVYSLATGAATDSWAVSPN